MGAFKRSKRYTDKQGKRVSEEMARKMSAA